MLLGLQNQINLRSGTSATLYWVAYPYYYGEPTQEQIVAGQDSNGDPGLAFGNVANIIDGLIDNINVTGMISAEDKYASFVAYDGTTYSNIVTTLLWGGKTHFNQIPGFSPEPIRHFSQKVKKVHFDFY